MKKNLAEQHAEYVSNAWPAILAILAKQIHVSVETLQALQVGWCVEKNAFATPERDPSGMIIGLSLRSLDGFKYQVKGSKRGLAFRPVDAPDGYDASRQRWGRFEKENPCPLCGGVKWCGYDASGDTPRFVRCMKQGKGAVYDDQGGGHIHELIEGSFRPSVSTATPLAQSEHPIVLVEGFSDVAAATEMGLVAIGRPSALGGRALLPQLVGGRSVVIMGEHDSGDGEKGMQALFETLKPVCPSAQKLMPPEGVKDLRAWRNEGLTLDGFLDALAATGEATTDPLVLEDDSPLAVARLWLSRTHTQKGALTLRKFNGEWYAYGKQGYRKVDPDADLRGPLYCFLEPMQAKTFASSGAVAIKPYRPTRNKITDLLDAMNAMCHVRNDPPCWLRYDPDNPQPQDLIVFENGILHVPTYLQGKPDYLLDPTPLYFSHSGMPFAFDPEAVCPQWDTFLDQVFDGDTQRAELLQEWFGYNLVPDTSMQKFLLCVGRPGSGKSTTLEVLQAIIGEDLCAKSSFKHLCSEFGLQPLTGKLAIILPDAHVPRQVDAIQALEMIKSIVGQDGVTVNRKFLTHLPSAKLPGRITVAVNELPELPDHARSLERRLLLLHFPQVFEGREDRGLRDKLVAEAPGILVWALQGLARLRYNKTFTAPDSSKPVVEEFRRALAPVAEFLYECCTQETDGWVPKNQLYDCWCTWAKRHGQHRGVRSRFGQRLLAQRADIVVSRVTVEGKQVRVYNGLALTQEAKDEYLG